MNGYKTDKIEYIDIDRWRKAIRDSRLHYESEAKKLDERLTSIVIEKEHIEHELERSRVEEELMSQTIRAYEERMEQPLKRSPLQGDNLRETIIIHFADPSGVIIGKETSKTLVDIGYFPDRNSADSAIYTALAKPPFKKRHKGIYVIPTDSPEWSRLKGTNGKKLDLQTKEQPTLQYSRKVSKNGIVKEVEGILISHPDWGQKKVRAGLERHGWDFGGKNPAFVINAAFLNIRQAKELAFNQTSQPRMPSGS